MNVIPKKLTAIASALLLGAALTGVSTMSHAQNTHPTEPVSMVTLWDKTFAQSDKVEHRKVSFKNRYGLTLVADLPRDRSVLRLTDGKALHGGLGLDAAIEQIHHGLGQGHLYAQGLGPRRHRAGAVHPFGHMAQRLYGLGQRHALRQQQAHTPVARQITRAGEHQVTQARQPHKGVHARPQGEAQPGDFGQAARDQGCTGIEPQRQAVAQARGNGQHVLYGTAHFHAHHIRVFVHTQGAAVKGLH